MLYLECGGTISDLMCPSSPERDDSMILSPVRTPRASLLQAQLEDTDDTGVVWGTPRAERLSLLQRPALEPYSEKDTPSPTPVRVKQLSAMLQDAYISEAPKPSAVPANGESPVDRDSARRLYRDAISTVDDSGDNDAGDERPSETDSIELHLPLPAEDFSDEMPPADDPYHTPVDKIPVDLAVPSPETVVKSEFSITRIADLRGRFGSDIVTTSTTIADIKECSKQEGSAIIIDKVRDFKCEVASPVRRTFRVMHPSYMQMIVSDVWTRC